MNQAKKKRRRRTTTMVLVAFALMPAAAGPQVTGTLGSPATTTTLDGKQLPPAEPAFGGVIEKTAARSKAWWPPRVVPPKDAPNVLLIMTDDSGYGVPGTFGGGRSTHDA